MERQRAEPKDSLKVRRGIGDPDSTTSIEDAEARRTEIPMSMARQLVVVSAILLTSALSGPARANNLGLTGIVSGGTLWWQGNVANTNVIWVTSGSCVINGSPMLPIIGQRVTTQGAGANAVFDVAVGQGGNYANSDVFYVYYMAYTNNLLYQPVISHTGPTAEGYPS